MLDFAAIDFETANGKRTSVCSVGVVIVRGGVVVDSIYRLIKPYPNYYASFCQQVHGMCDEDTCNAELFPAVWREIAEKIGSLPLVAHNASFDQGCLKAVHDYYGMYYPDYPFYDTLTASRRIYGKQLPNHQLHTVAAVCGFDLKNHHHALADAEACAAIAIRLL